MDLSSRFALHTKELCPSVPARASRVALIAGSRLAILLALLLSVQSTLGASPRQFRPSTPTLAVLYDELVPKLKAGGVYIYITPLQTVSGISILAPERWRDCTSKSLISVDGQRDASRIHSAIKKLGLHVSYAQSADACVALSTRTFILNGIPTVLATSPELDPEEIQLARPIPKSVVRALIEGQFKNGQADAVKLMVGAPLGISITPHPVLSLLGLGETAVFADEGSDAPKLLARLTPKQWAEMADYWERHHLRVKKR
jgi:hypothetical protein